MTRGKLAKTDTTPTRVADGSRRTASAGAVLRAVLDNGPIARSTIARITGLSPASVTGHCADLTTLGLLRELPDQVRSNGAGRPHIPVDLDVSRHVVASVHVAVPVTTTALLDVRGRVLARSRTPHDPATDPERILEDAARSLDVLCARYGVGGEWDGGWRGVGRWGVGRLGGVGRRPGTDRLGVGVRVPLGIGVATGGWVDPASGTVMDHPRLGWSLVPVRDWFGERTGLPVRVDGHSRALLHGEVLFGGAREASSVLHVFVGNVVEAAFATRGAAHYGSRAQAGVIAHLPVEGSREPCSCGRIGCLEATVSEETLARRAYERGLIAAPDFGMLLQAARVAGMGGVAGAAELLVERSRVLGRAVAMLMDLFGPELVVVTDQGLSVVPAALAALRGVVRENVRMVCDVDKMLIPSAFGDDVLETAGGAVILDALYRDPLGFAPRMRSSISSEDCNVDTWGARR